MPDSTLAADSPSQPSRRMLLGLIALGYLLRWLLMPWTEHFDALLMPWLASVMRHGAWNVYAAVHATFGPATLAPIPWAPNLPGYYVLMAAWLAVPEALGRFSFTDWRTLAPIDGLTLSTAGAWQLAFEAVALDLPHRAEALLWLKLPNLAADVATGLLLLRLGGPRGGLVAWAAWALAPVVIFDGFVMGQADLWPALSLTAALWAARRALSASGSPAETRWAVLAMVWLALGAWVKTMPLLAAPLFAAALARGRWRRGLLLLGVSGLVFVCGVLPFLGTPAFMHAALVNHEGMALLGGRTPGGGALMTVLAHPFPALWLALCVWLSLVGRAASPRDREVQLQSAVLLLLLGLFATAAVPPYWHVWLTPLLALAAARDPRFLIVLVADAIFVGLRLPLFNGELGLSAARFTRELSFVLPYEDRLTQALPWVDGPALAGLAADSVWIVATGLAALWLLAPPRSPSGARFHGGTATLALALLAPIAIAGGLLAFELLTGRQEIGPRAVLSLVLPVVSDGATTGWQLRFDDPDAAGFAVPVIGEPGTAVGLRAALSDPRTGMQIESVGGARIGRSGRSMVALPGWPEAWRDGRPIEVRLAIDAPPGAATIGLGADGAVVAPMLRHFRLRSLLRDVAGLAVESPAFVLAWLLAPLLAPVLGLALGWGVRILRLRIPSAARSRPTATRARLTLPPRRP